MTKISASEITLERTQMGMRAVSHPEEIWGHRF